EVGLPYYLRKKKKMFSLDGYIEVLEQFIQLAKKLNKPIVLHAIYEDAPIVIDLLEKHSITKAHFHWFKGNQKTIEHMKENGYYISVTPDVLYEPDIQHLINLYTFSQIMVETDGPWQFEGSFSGQRTNPNMLHQVLGKIAEIKQMNSLSVYQQMYHNTSRF